MRFGWGNAPHPRTLTVCDAVSRAPGPTIEDVQQIAEVSEAELRHLTAAGYLERYEVEGQVEWHLTERGLAVVR